MLPEAKLERRTSTSSKKHKIDKDKTLPYYDVLELEVPNLADKTQTKTPAEKDTETPAEVQVTNQNVPTAPDEKPAENELTKDEPSKQSEKKNDDEKPADEVLREEAKNVTTGNYCFSLVSNPQQT